MDTNVTTRIKELIEELGYSAGQFADVVKINRSRLSHIITGRNNPSLEIVQAIIKRFPEINPLWLLIGNEPMFLVDSPAKGKISNSQDESNTEINLFNYHQPDLKKETDEVKTQETNQIHKQVPVTEKEELKSGLTEIETDYDEVEIRMITVFYTNKRYENFIPE